MFYHFHTQVISNLVKYSEYLGSSAAAIKGVESIQVFRRMEPNMRTGTLEFLLNPHEARMSMGVNVGDFLQKQAAGYIESSISNYMQRLRIELHNMFDDYVEIENKVLSSVQNLKSNTLMYREELQMDEVFMRYCNKH